MRFRGQVFVEIKNRVVTKEMAIEFKEKHGLLGYVETSARSGQNVKDVRGRSNE